MDKLAELKRILELYPVCGMGIRAKKEITLKEGELTFVISHKYDIESYTEAIIKKSEDGKLKIEYCCSYSGQGDNVLSYIGGQVESLNKKAS